MYYAGFLSSSVGNNQKRDTFFNRVLKIASHNSDFRVGVAETYYFDKEYQRSLDILDSLEADSLKQIEYYYTLKGLSNYMLKQYGKAIDNYKKILEIDSSYNNYITLTMLGEVYSMMGKTDTALYYYNIQYNIDSNNVYLLNNYAYILSKEKKDLDRALAMSAKTLEVSPNNSAYLDTYGWIKYQMEDYDTALEYIKKAVDLGDASAEVYEHLGDTYIKLGETAKAKEMYLKSLEIEADRFKLEDKLKDKTGK
jgi:tetratricopeptide (TPR) repeat protein